MIDVIIIGAGIVGCAAARELSRYALDVRVLEREADVACGASKANSGIVHAGYDCVPGTRKAALNVHGVELYKTLTDELDIPYRNNGSMVICLRDEDLPHLQALYERGVQNGVPGLSILNGDEARAREPHLSADVKAVLLAESAGVISPYEATVAFAENAAVNGVQFLLETEVTSLSGQNGSYTVKTKHGDYTARIVINTAGIESGFIHNQVCKHRETIKTQRGQYYLLDNTQKNLVSHTMFQLPTVLGKGVLIAPTVDYNILVGPNAEDGVDPCDKQTTRQGLKEVLDKARLTLKEVPIGDRITAFAGVRAKHDSQDFVIEEPLPGFVEALGIDSPGLSAAPAIALQIAEKVVNRLSPPRKPDFIARREAIKRFKSLTFDEQAALIRENPLYGHVVCRCETVTEGEIVDAIRRPVGARNLDALKRRTRTQMGRCQGGFCTLRLMEILSREWGVPETDITKNGDGSPMLLT